MRSKKLLLVSVLAIIAFLTAALLPGTSAIAQGVKGDPVPASPHGLIVDQTPIYKWTAVTDATGYQFQVWKDSTKILDRLPNTSTCNWTYCNRTPDVTLGYSDYKWRVRAKVAGVWGAWSGYIDFTVSPPSFYSSFNGSRTGWRAVGSSMWYTDATKLYTYIGSVGQYASIYASDGMYTDFTYSASIRATGQALADHFIVFRAGTNTHPKTKDWYPAYVFGISRTYMVGVYKIDSTGNYISIHPWDGDFVLNSHYNTLKVEAKGNTFKCYLNGSLVVTFTDSSLKKGYVGLKAYKWFNGNMSFWADWAMLKVLSTPQ